LLRVKEGIRLFSSRKLAIGAGTTDFFSNLFDRSWVGIIAVLSVG